MTPRGYTDLEFSLSLRLRDGHLVCAFVSTVAVESSRQAMFLDSKHLTGCDEQLVDSALAEIRHQVLEHGLSPVEPF